MAVDPHKNFAYSTVLTAPSPATSGTSLVVQSGDGAKFPAASFNATIWPAGGQPTTANAEIVRVTVVSTDTFTITRAQESSSARTVIVGDQIAATITAKTLTDVEAGPPTTNANLSGNVTSSGNVTTIAAGVVTEAMQVTADNTTNNVVSTKHGYAPKSPAVAGKFLNGAATPAYTIPGDATKAYFESGCVWSGDAYASTLNASMTAGIVWIAGNRLVVNAITAHAMTASKDMYIDFTDNGDGTAVPTYITTTANNAASPALTAGGIRNAIIVTGATNILSVASINQGQETKVLPIASSIPYQVTDSLGNLICGRDPDQTIIGYRQCIVDVTTTSSVDITGLNLTCIIPAGRKVRVSAWIGSASASVVNDAPGLLLVDVTAAANISQSVGSTNASSNTVTLYASAISSLGGTRNFKAQLNLQGNAATIHTNSSATNPAYIMVELV